MKEAIIIKKRNPAINKIAFSLETGLQDIFNNWIFHATVNSLHQFHHLVCYEWSKLDK